MPKRKAEVLGEDTNANAAPPRKTRSSGPVPPELPKANAKRPTRSGDAAPEPPMKAGVTRTYCRTNQPIRTASHRGDTKGGGDAEPDQPQAEEVKALPVGKVSRGRPKATAEVDAASSSSKENVKRVSTRSWGKANELQSALNGAEDEKLGGQEVEAKARQAPKRRKVAAVPAIGEQDTSVPVTRSRRGTTTTYTPSVEAKPAVKRRGRTTKSNAPRPIAPADGEAGETPAVEEVLISAALPAPPRRKGRPTKAKAQAPIPAAGEGQSTQAAPLSPEIAVVTPRRSKAKASPLPVLASDEDADSDEEAPPSPLKNRRLTQPGSSAGRRPRSPTAHVDDASSKKRREPPRSESPLFSEPEEEQEVPHRAPAPAPSSPSKKRVVVVEITPKTPRRPRGTAAARGAGETTDLSSPVRQPVFPTTPSGRLQNGSQSVPNSPTKRSAAPLIQEHLVPCLNSQKRAVLLALANPPVPPTPGEIEKGKAKAIEGDEDFDNGTAYGQLKDLLEGTVVRNEGNSCLLLGPKGSGKTRLFERCLSEIAQSDSNAKPIIIRLSGWVQSNDRLALRQIAIQLAEQTGNSYLSQFSDTEETERGKVAAENDDDNPFLDSADSGDNGAEAGIFLPSAAHLPALIAELPKLKRPTIVLVDAFDLFSLHPRQALLYCLLDTVQACQSAQGNKGLAIIGLTSRVDVVSLLEKRVKSRFSGRILRVSNVPREEGWTGIVRRCLLSPAILPPNEDETTESDMEEWTDLWAANVEKFLTDSTTKQLVHETYSIVRDVRVLIRVLTPAIARLSPSQPFPAVSLLQRATQSQRTRTAFTPLYALPYPALCLLIAGHHSHQKGHPIFNFEMLYEAFRVQLRASTAAPIQLNGTSIGMVKCPRSVMLSAFETLVTTRIFVAAAASNLTTPKEFVKYRSVVEREDLKKAVEKAGQVNLRKWWNKS